MAKSKNFFYRVNPESVLSEITSINHTEWLQWFLDFFHDLRNDDPESAKSELASNIISEAHGFREKRAVAGKASAEQRATKGQHQPTNGEHMLKDVQPVAVAVTVTKDLNLCREILDDLNRKGGFRYRTGKEINGFINGRVSDGFTKEDFFHVHTVMIDKWKDDPKMSRYIRPSTLYRPTHFQEYLNQPAPKKKKIIQNADGDFVEVPDDY